MACKIRHFCIQPSESKDFQYVVGVRMGHINSDLSGIRPNGIT